MQKINFKQFRYLMSAMLFISDALDKEEQIHDLYVIYKQQHFDPDPVVWLRDVLRGCRAGTHDMYIRRSFASQNYNQVLSGS